MAVVWVLILLTVATAHRASEASHGTFILPFDPGVTMYVCQGYESTFTHANTFALDLTAGATCNSTASGGLNVRAPFAGTVHQPSSSGLGELCLRTNDGIWMRLVHINSSLSPGANVAQDQIVGSVAVAGQQGNGGGAHLHIEAYVNGDCAGTSDDIPFDTGHGTILSGIDLPWNGQTSIPGGQHKGAALTRPPACSGPDTDGDGVLDSCDPDDDNDGILDANDWCPANPETFNGFDDSDGCPESDYDADGIPDDYDYCGDEPEDLDGWEDLDGCPENDGGVIMGTVTTQGSSAPIPDICVWAFGADSGFAVTDNAGDFWIEVPAGDYHLRYSDCLGTTDYIEEWYDDQPSETTATTVSAQNEQFTQGIDAALVLGGSISGTVAYEGNAAPVTGVCVTAYRQLYQWAGGVQTDANGDYTIRGLTGGDYTVEFAECYGSAGYYVPEWYDNDSDSWQASPVSVTLGLETVGIDASLTPAGIISGTVAAEESGIPLASICVYTGGLDPPFSSKFTRTDASGDYANGGLPGGDYHVAFSDCSTTTYYAQEWHANKPDYDSADVVTVTPGTISDIDATLLVGGSVSGMVTDETTGVPLEGICVSAANQPFFGSSGKTNAAGGYHIGGLSTGQYVISFFDCRIPSTHLSESFDDNPDSASFDAVLVTVGSETGGIDAALVLGGSISGIVTEEGSGTPLENVCVHLNGGTEARTDAGGEYAFTGLRSGQYNLEFADCPPPPQCPPFPGFPPPPCGLPITGGGPYCTGDTSIPKASIHVPEWYDDAPNCLASDSVSVTEGLETSGIDVALAVGGAISGVVTDEVTGDPLEWICVLIQNTSNSVYAYHSDADASGAYRIGGLPSGDYEVFFCSDNDHGSEWYDNQPGVTTANTVSVVIPAATGGVNAALERDDDSDGVANSWDNCPGATNWDQANTDSDAEGNACDGDDDNDAVPDGSDNCPAWYNSGQVLPVWSIPAEDADCDGFNLDREQRAGTDPNRHCPATSTPNDEPLDAWPSDFNDSQITTLADVVLMGSSYNKLLGQPGYNNRFDLNGSDSVTLADVVMMGPFYNKSCAP